jgi:hypothetical protein
MVLAALLIAAAIIPLGRLTAQSGCDSRVDEKSPALRR